MENNKCDARSMRGVDEDFVWSFGRQKGTEVIVHSTYTERGGDNIKMYLESGKGVICINLSQDRDKWRAVVKTGMNNSVKYRKFFLNL